MFSDMLSQHVSVLAVFPAQVARVAGMDYVACLYVLVHVALARDNDGTGIAFNLFQF